MNRIICILSLVVALSGCVATTSDVELPQEGTGTDEMKPSPCVCQPVEFNSEGFTWRG